jgi:hypothetical protein
MSSSVLTLTPDVPPQLKSVDDASSRHQAVENRVSGGVKGQMLEFDLATEQPVGTAETAQQTADAQLFSSC